MPQSGVISLVLPASQTLTPLAAPSGSTRTYSLLIAVLLRGTKYTALTTSLLAQPELSIQQVEDALKNEEAHCLGVAAAAAAAVSSPVSNLAAPAVGSICAFCGRNGHTVEQCFKFRDASKAAKEQVQQQESSGGSKKQWKKKGKANAAQEPLLRLHPLNQQERQVFVHPHLPAPSLMPRMQTQGPLLI